MPIRLTPPFKKRWNNRKNIGKDGTPKSQGSGASSSMTTGSHTKKKRRNFFFQDDDNGHVVDNEEEIVFLNRDEMLENGQLLKSLPISNETTPLLDISIPNFSINGGGMTKNKYSLSDRQQKCHDGQQEHDEFFEEKLNDDNNDDDDDDNVTRLFGKNLIKKRPLSALEYTFYILIIVLLTPVLLGLVLKIGTFLYTYTRHHLFSQEDDDNGQQVFESRQVLSYLRIWFDFIWNLITIACIQLISLICIIDFPKQPQDRLTLAVHPSSPPLPPPSSLSLSPSPFRQQEQEQQNQNDDFYNNGKEEEEEENNNNDEKRKQIEKIRISKTLDLQEQYRLNQRLHKFSIFLLYVSILIIIPWDSMSRQQQEQGQSSLSSSFPIYMKISATLCVLLSTHWIIQIRRTVDPFVIPNGQYPYYSSHDNHNHNHQHHHHYHHHLHHHRHCQDYKVQDGYRKQKLSHRGLYGIVRHPLYLGCIIAYISFPLSLGSYWGLLPMLTIVMILLHGIKLKEELLLQVYGSDYENYQTLTRYRVIPCIF